MENVAATFQYYDKRGRRLACFCRFLSAEMAEIFVLTCSKDDQFNKKKARAAYDRFVATGDTTGYKPAITLVVIPPEQRELQTLIYYCKDNFYFKMEVIEVVMALVKESELDIEF